MRRLHQSAKIVLLAALLVLGYAVAAPLLPWRAQLAEANFHANLIRLQAFSYDSPPRSVIVGSSISGRLLPSYFAGTPLSPMANLGLDGSSPQFGLELIQKRNASVVLIEENKLLKAWDANDDSLVAATKSPSFQLARTIPLLRARYRPSSVLYTWLKLRRDNESSGQAFPPVALTRSGASHASAANLSPQTTAIVEKLRGQMKAILAAGTQIVLVRIPAGATGEDPVAFAVGAQLARELNLLELDLPAECARRGATIQYTDGMHLTPASARAVSRMIGEMIEKADTALRENHP